jgi:hypothetical protein
VRLTKCSSDWPTPRNGDDPTKDFSIGAGADEDEE